MTVDIRLRFKKNKTFLGKGVRIMLLAIDETGSISAASKKTGISYPKALRMIKTLTDELGFEVIVSEKGGAKKGGSKLTPKGRALLEKYGEIEDELLDYAKKLVAEKLPDL